MSVTSFLSRTASTAVLGLAEQKSITASIHTLEQRLTQYFPIGAIERKLQFGSSTRGTILPRFIDEQSDIDYMVVFSDSTYTTTTYLNRLRGFVEKRYSSSNVYQSHPTIVLDLNHIKFELVPAIETFWNGLQIPGKEGNWIRTDPNDFNERLTRKNVKYHHQIKPAIRLAKIWNARAGFPLDSYQLEKQICGISFDGNANLRDIFFKILDVLEVGSFAPKWIKEQLLLARARVAKIRKLESQGTNGLAVLEARRLLGVR